MRRKGQITDKLKRENETKQTKERNRCWNEANSNGEKKYLTLLMTRVLLAVHIIVPSALHDAAHTAHELDARSHLHVRGFRCCCFEEDEEGRK